MSHDTVETPNWDTKQRCSCGAEFVSKAELYFHQIPALREEVDALIEGRVQMWCALANIRDACGPDSEFRIQAERAIGTSHDPTDGTPEQVGVEMRRKIAGQRQEARARAEALRVALVVADSLISLTLHSGEDRTDPWWKAEAETFIRESRKLTDQGA